MVSVILRFVGCSWRPMTLPISVQVAQALAAAAKQLKLGDDVEVRETPRQVDRRA